MVVPGVVVGVGVGPSSFFIVLDAPPRGFVVVGVVVEDVPSGCINCSNEVNSSSIYEKK